MCERPGYWRWLFRVLIEKIGNPFFETIIGAIAGLIFLVLSICNYDFYMTFGVRVALALLTVPSFLVFMHGIYREDDC